jgi:hypothetical protein
VSEFGARLSRVRMKSGADLSLLPTPLNFGDPADPENWRGKLVQHAKQIADNDETGSKLDGFIVLGMYSDGSTSIGYRLPDRLPRCLIPAYAAEILRRDVITDNEAELVFDRKFEWVEN